MHKVRVIARLDIKSEFVIKGIHLEGLRKIGDPNILARRYYEQGVDELLFMDAVAAYYDRNSLSEIIEKACQDVFVPITVGGGIRTLEDIQKALHSGADKVAINTQAHRRPEFITEAAEKFGSQCIVASVVAKERLEGGWEAYIENGREPTGRDVMEWVIELQKMGAGELMITSVDKEGTKRGFDIALCKAVAEIIKIPLICSGGAGNSMHLVDLAKRADIDAIAVASILHYNYTTIEEMKSKLQANDFEVRRCICV